jgi:hypothetical protein
VSRCARVVLPRALQHAGAAAITVADEAQGTVSLYSTERDLRGLGRGAGGDERHGRAGSREPLHGRNPVRGGRGTRLRRHQSSVWRFLWRPCRRPGHGVGWCTDTSYDPDTPWVCPPSPWAACMAAPCWQRGGEVLCECIWHNSSWLDFGGAESGCKQMMSTVPGTFDMRVLAGSEYVLGACKAVWLPRRMHTDT